MRTLNPQKLLNSKWTAVSARNKEKHVLVVELEFDDEGINVTQCTLEAIMTKRTQFINWHELKDSSVWIQGWV